MNACLSHTQKQLGPKLKKCQKCFHLILEISLEIQCIAMATIMDEYLHLGKYRNAFSADPEGPGPAAFFLTGISIIAILVTLPLSLCLCIKVILP